MASQCCVWDFTAPEDSVSQADLVRTLEINCKQWCFQLEEGEGGYRHWQGRMNLKVKQRLSGAKKVICEQAHLSITSNANRDNMFYVLKEDTRVNGPWSSTDEKVFIPWDVQLMVELRPWQSSVVRWAQERELRKCRVIFCPGGNTGKTSLCRYMLCHGLGQTIPFANDFRDILRMVCDMPTSKLYLIDMPRAISKEKLFQFWGAIEQIKSGYAYDDRYKFRQKVFDPPQVVVFTNVLPDRSLLSEDRWDLYQIVNSALIPYVVEHENVPQKVVGANAVTLDDLDLTEWLQ